MSAAIEFCHVSKQYRLGYVSSRTISSDIQRWITMNILGKEDPFLKIGETNDRSTKGSSDYVWALKDIDFKVEQGEVLGIIGKNGAGKSTLLKLLSRVTSPSTGLIRAKGRIASLLEVGTGFHQELTGRENIYMNGAILGMTRKEIRGKLDEIVEFSGCERYIDTPVKRYSSGMMVRLGFAVAAHLDPEILVVDEVLAVGDAEFQRKAIGKMQDVSKGEGRTVLFVSHNMASVKSLCTKGILLKNGMVDYSGTVEDTINRYLKYNEASRKGKIIENVQYVKPTLHITKIEINGTENSESVLLSGQKSLKVRIEGETTERMKYDVKVVIKNKESVPYAIYANAHTVGEISYQDKGKFVFEREIELPKMLCKGSLLVDLCLHHPTVEYQMIAENCCVLNSMGYQNSYGQVLLASECGFYGMSDSENKVVK